MTKLELYTVLMQKLVTVEEKMAGFAQLTKNEPKIVSVNKNGKC